ncbi:MAG: GTPase ObgE [Bacillales bacterium]|nr:GTPase ObgE [Bacillales bacterium]MDY5920362.1 GTPase ObgE [Candidatus Enteromonas sp.]
MLIDRAVVEVRSGNGGNGAISFHREKNVPKGGPDGGNGGRGGSVFLVAKKNVNTLLAYRHSRVLQANDGEKGDKCLRFGRNSPDVISEVPCGTLIFEEDGKTLIADLKNEGDMVCVAKGGRGGRGNAAFKSSRIRVPRVAENGYPGVRKRIVLELKLLADAGLIGFPSVGKSTLLNIVTKANVATADYPFTTIVPNLGVVTLEDGYHQFVLADMPGLIEGAHEGKGLGIQFLRHIERCRVLVHMVSMSGERDPFEDFKIINAELRDFGAGLENRPQIVVATKMDEEGAEERKAEFDKKTGIESIGISAITDENVSFLMKKIFEMIQKTPEFAPYSVPDEEIGGLKVYDAHLDAPKDPFEIVHPSDHLFIITGEEVTKKYALINLSTDAGVAQLISYLGRIGIDEALKEKGAKDGDTVRIQDFEFDYYE